MYHSFANGYSLLRAQFNGPVLQVDEQPAFQYEKELIVIIMLMPVIFTLDDTDTYDAVIHLRQGLIEPFVLAGSDYFRDIDQFEVLMQYVQFGNVRK
jgi:hypothetical protein